MKTKKVKKTVNRLKIRGGNHMENILFTLVMVLAGLFSLIASICNWNFFFENRRAYLFVKLFGRNGARIFYSLLGLALIIGGFVIKP
jgi:hypothetical protein